MQFRRLVWVLVLLSPIACGKKEQAPQQAVVSTAEAAPKVETEEDKAFAARMEAKDIFKKKCLVCHGENGQGDGPGAAALDPKPRNFAEASWQKEVTDDQISKAIIGGGAAVGKSPIMPGNPELKAKPDSVKELVAIIRGFKK